MMRNGGLFRDLFSTPDMRAVWSDEATIATWLEVEQAIAVAQAELGLIDGDAARAIVAISVEQIDGRRLAHDALLVGRPIVGFVTQLRELVGPKAAPHVHCGVTTFDILDSALSLRARDAQVLVDQDCATIMLGLERLIAKYGNLPTIGRTNHQHAIEMAFGTRLKSWYMELERRREALREAAAAGLMVQLGGAVGELSNWSPEVATALRINLARQLGLGTPASSWQNARDGLAQIVSTAGLLGATLSRIGRNVNLLSSTEIAEMREEHRFGQGASSAMAHKRNQRASEYVEGLGRAARQSAERIGETMLHDFERSGGVLIAEWPIMPETFLHLSGALKWGTQMLDRLIVDPDRIAKNLLGKG